MNYLLYNKRSYITARMLATQLGLKATRSVDRIKKAGKAPVIRYGNSSGFFGDRDTKINSPSVINMCANSRKFSLWCREHNYYSPFYKKFDPYNIPEYPFLLRRLHHMRGKDIILVRNDNDLRKISQAILANRYWVPFISTTFELRVHVINGEIVRVFKKVKPGALEKGEFIRTSVKDWKYSLRENLDKKYLRAQELCINLVNDLGLFFAGIDIAWDNVNRKYIIWEVNTAPGLSTVTAKIYADKLRRFI